MMKTQGSLLIRSKPSHIATKEIWDTVKSLRSMVRKMHYGKLTVHINILN